MEQLVNTQGGLPTKYRTINDDWVFYVRINDDDLNVLTGLPQPYTGLSDTSITATIRHRSTKALLWSGDRNSGITINDPSTGDVKIQVPKAIVGNAAIGQYYKADVQITIPGGIVLTPIKFLISPTDEMTIAP